MICALWRKSALSLPTIVILAQLRQALSQSTLACPSHLLSPAGTCLSASPGALGGTSRSSGDTVPSTRASILATTGSSASSAAAAATSSSARAAKSGQKMDWEKAAKMSWAAPYVMDLKPGPPDLAPGAPLPVLFVSHGSPMSAVQDTPVSSFWKLLGEKVRPEIRHSGVGIIAFMLPLSTRLPILVRRLSVADDPVLFFSCSLVLVGPSTSRLEVGSHHQCSLGNGARRACQHHREASDHP